jgi:arylsulfatase A-like enzyme
MTAPRPNVLLLLVDCMRADALGGRNVPTPNLDALVARGTSCTQAIASASSTTPCVATMLSGLYSPRHGVRSIGAHRLNAHVPMLGTELAAAGYHTIAEVTGPLGPEAGLDRGFAEYHVRPASVYLSDGWGRELVARIAGGAIPQPWFLFLHVWELHAPRKVLPAFRQRRFGKTRYDRALASFDATVAPLLAALPANTTIVLHGDHGERVVGSTLAYRWYRLRRDLLGAGRTRKLEGHETDVYEDLVRVPLAVIAPGKVPAGGRVDQLVRQVDLMPTILDLVDVPVPAGLDGTSLVPALRDGRALGLEAFIEAFGRVRGTERDRRLGWRTERWKYVEAPHAPEVPVELFDLAADPRERRNVAADEPERVAELRARVASVEATAVGAGDALSAEEEAAVEARLRDLGYIE